MRGEKCFKILVEGGNARGGQHYSAIIKIEEYLTQNKNKKKSHKTKSNIKYIRFEKKLIQKEYHDNKIPSLVEDLFNIALASFSADKLVKRDIMVNTKRVDGRYYTRKIKLVIPVSDIKHWNKVKHQLEKTISFMTYDIFKYEFIKKNTDTVDIIQKDDEYNSISLFSGGLDSLAGSFFLSENDFNPIYVSVNHSGIGNILENLYRHLPDGSTREIGVYISKFDSSESTQFSRSFLYLTTAVSIALAHKNAKTILVPENGIIARQIGMMEGRHGTRTAHPRFLKSYNELINSVFPEHKLTIENPFTYLTKKEIVEKIKEKSLIRKTISCAHTLFLHKNNDKPEHCGMGIPCLIRTIALISSKNVNKESDLNLKFNPFLIDFNNPDKKETEDHPTVNRWYRDGLVNVLDVIRFALEINKLTKGEMIMKHPEFLDDEIYLLYRRFSDNILETVEHYKKINPSLEDVINKFTS